jgi:hypothetical protein
MFFDTFDRILSAVAGVDEYTPKQLTNKIRTQFAGTDFSFKTHKDSTVDLGTVVVSGLYDEELDHEGLPAILIMLHYNPAEQSISLSADKKAELAFGVAECVGHELVHRSLVSKPPANRIPKYLLEQSDDHGYLGDPGEIEAYGFSIASESILYRRPISECAMYTVYNSLFMDSVVMKLLDKKIFKYYKKLELEYVRKYQSN